LHDVQQAIAWEYAAQVRKLFTWDASKEAVLPLLGPLKTEATYVRLEAAATAMCFGDRDAIPSLIELLRHEARHEYAPEGGPNAKWWGFPTRSLTLEALMVLDATEVLSALDEVLGLEVWPHGIDAVARARVVLG
jgi:HEAT repeat protein